MKQKSYHTSIKTCYALGLEEILPESLREDIPRSTSHYWKSEQETKYVGHEFAARVSKNLDQTSIILNDRVKHERALFVAFCRIKLTIINFIGRRSFTKLLQSNKPQVVSMVEKVKPLFGTNTICKFLNIEPKTYSVWKVKTALHCPLSKINLCFKKVSHQITSSEVMSIQKFMTDPRYMHWPTASVWALATRTGEVVMSRASWYKYLSLLDLKRRKVSRRYKPKKKGIKADQPNEIWHADVSVYKTLDHVKYYIYTVVDNYSRMILSWDISTKLSAQIRLKSIQRAIEEQFNIDPKGKSIDLIVDGGSENNNGIIHEFIQNNKVSINKKIALKDIIQSNSLVEATYKIMKYKYFYNRQIVSNAMIQEMEFFVDDYNNIRPHYSHHYLTPYEVHKKRNPLDYKKIIKQAIKDRVVSNREQSCSIDC